MRKLFLLLILCFVFYSCASTPRGNFEISPGTYPHEYETIINDFLKLALKDYDSAKIDSISEPVEITNKYPWYPNLRVGHMAYRCRVNINAKNAYGGYVGYRLYDVFIRHQRVYEFQKAR